MASPGEEETVTLIEEAVVNSQFCSKTARKSLRITCYGSSSAKTPERYLKEARALGYILAKRGHVCVNGAGSYGCMAAMNDGAVSGNGHIVGVIHEMFLVDNGFFAGKEIDRDGGAHQAFNRSSNTTKGEEGGPIREILVAGGDDLQQRKKFLVDKADAILVLPGGPGTWDELWEMACARHLGLVKMPIVCVNVDGYYEPFQEMLERAYEDELIKLKPHEIVHFASSSEEAIRWVEDDAAGKTLTKLPSPARRSSALRKSSFYHSGFPISSSIDDDAHGTAGGYPIPALIQAALVFGVGMLVGVSAAHFRR